MLKKVGRRRRGRARVAYLRIVPAKSHSSRYRPAYGASCTSDRAFCRGVLLGFCSGSFHIDLFGDLMSALRREHDAGRVTRTRRRRLKVAAAATSVSAIAAALLMAPTHSAVAAVTPLCQHRMSRTVMPTRPTIRATTSPPCIGLPMTEAHSSPWVAFPFCTPRWQVEPRTGTFMHLRRRVLTRGRCCASMARALPRRSGSFRGCSGMQTVVRQLPVLTLPVRWLRAGHLVMGQTLTPILFSTRRT